MRIEISNDAIVVKIVLAGFEKEWKYEWFLRINFDFFSNEVSKLCCVIIFHVSRRIYIFNEQYSTNSSFYEVDTMCMMCNLFFLIFSFPSPPPPPKITYRRGIEEVENKKIQKRRATDSSGHAITSDRISAWYRIIALDIARPNGDIPINAFRRWNRASSSLVGEKGSCIATPKADSRYPEAAPAVFHARARDRYRNL